MKREVLFVSLFLLVIYLSSFVAAQQNPIIDPIKDLFAFQADLAVSTNITKYLFIILLSLLIWSILESSGLINNNGARWGISIIVSFLSISYFTTEDVIGILLTYNALGLTFLFLLPFMILLFFTWRVVSHFRSPGAVIFQYFMWIVYGIFLVYSFITSWTDISDGGKIAFTVVGAATLIMILGNKWIRKKLSKEFLDAEIDAATSTEKKASALTKARSDAVEDESGS